jgi:hypothetical protein
MGVDFNQLKYPEKFHDFCRELIKAEYPSAKSIGGSKDEGIDLYVGKFNKRIESVFQFKYFTTRLKNSQKGQIKHSLKTAYKKHKPQKWTLCVPINFSPIEAKWFEKLRQNYERKKVNLEYLGETDLKHLLRKHLSIQQEYFPKDPQLNKVMRELKEKARLKNIYELSDKFARPVGYCKVNITGWKFSELLKNIKNSASQSYSGFSKKIIGDTSQLYRARYLFCKGSDTVKIVPSRPDYDPFKIIFPHVDYVDILIEDKTKKVPSITLHIFTASKHHKTQIINTLKQLKLATARIEEVTYDKFMKKFTAEYFAESIIAIEFDPVVVEQIKGVGNIHINRNKVVAEEPGLPKTKFIGDLIKSLKQEGTGGLSDILYFRAIQTAKFSQGKLLTIEVFRDGRVIGHFPKKDFKTMSEIRQSLIKFGNKIHLV